MTTANPKLLPNEKKADLTPQSLLDLEILDQCVDKIGMMRMYLQLTPGVHAGELELAYRKVIASLRQLAAVLPTQENTNEHIRDSNQGS